ncbi:hypothetical protein HPB51_003380 [Rhipicephalus microplus]|uniref:C2H2-type domain-containing protein n=1 Tax=Rhipicephalus microplus TaxID=6941 RepID=A0A9J6D3V7_RHIMP|nr:hypothetical protein HPB51_003380 [Rhipicephalus microplus]
MHEFIHKEEKPYACLVCGLKFVHNASFIRHKSKHTGLVEYACSVCPSKFFAKASLDRHKKLHAAGVQLFHCTECSWAFLEKTALEKHLKGHKTDKPYLCHLCPSRFTKRCNLKAHVKRHTGKKLYECPICQRQHSRPSYLKEHMRRMHPGENVLVSPQTSQPPEDWGSALLRTDGLVGLSPAGPDHGRGQRVKGAIESTLHSGCSALIEIRKCILKKLFKTWTATLEY